MVTWPLTRFYPERAEPAGARVPTAFAVKGKAREFARAVLASAPERSSLRGKVGFDDLVRNMAVVAKAVQAEKGYLPHDVQLIAAFEMLQGKLVEMQTGEGKTLVAVLVSAIHAMAGRRVHVITANDYLAARDAEIMGGIYRRLGLRVEAIPEGASDTDKARIYRGDVTYLTAKQVMFDHLRDRIKLGSTAGSAWRRNLKVAVNPGDFLLPGLEVAVIDEADSILVDEAVVPLILSQSSGAAGLGQIGRVALDLARGLEEDKHFTHDRRRRDLWLLKPGQEALKADARAMGGIFQNALWREQYVLQALMALHIFARDRDYILRDGRVEIVDVNTGRTMKDRSWERGLHQMIEAKEGVAITAPNETIARTSSQTFFPRYLRLCGMSGTIGEVRHELRRVYGLDYAVIPTRLPSRRAHLGVVVHETADQKRRDVARRAARAAAEGRAVLIGTRTVSDSEALSLVLAEEGVAHQVLNARQDAEEAAIIAGAGAPGRVTVATNMAGRGTDIALPAQVVAAGGLHVIATERHDSRRIDRQLFGRAARQGDPGSCEEVLSLEDDLPRRFLPKWLRHILTRPGLGWLADRALARAQARADRRTARQRIDLARMERYLAERLAFAGAGVAHRDPSH
ncbi:DEAD/DEAH box helicase [Stagnihabitans tardus]|uniref:Protein translocase subunit SecA n=1 Tax=Stagnihabitans tardus TaxID=2699202 RepID=A0AAE4Y8S6_9RHOB|nr:DEAD/DEAH box helicase [Stagnihabitans tardus]NBZ86768.1 hypothetical protein [Stagnihabitans tardus]